MGHVRRHAALFMSTHRSKDSGQQLFAQVLFLLDLLDKINYMAINTGLKGRST